MKISLCFMEDVCAWWEWINNDRTVYFVCNLPLKVNLMAPFIISAVQSIKLMSDCLFPSSAAEIQRSDGKPSESGGTVSRGVRSSESLPRGSCAGRKTVIFQFITSDSLRHDSHFCPVGTTFCCWDQISAGQKQVWTTDTSELC